MPTELLRTMRGFVPLETPADIALAVQDCCARHPLLKRLYLFGSRARGTHAPTSDYDLYAVLDYAHMRSGADYLALVNDLERVLGGRVDFVSGEVWGPRDRALKEEIDRDKVLLYDRDAQSENRGLST